VAALRTALAAAGVEFTLENGGGSGVRLNGRRCRSLWAYTLSAARAEPVPQQSHDSVSTASVARATTASPTTTGASVLNIAARAIASVWSAI
jgi:hypothetical protein